MGIVRESTVIIDTSLNRMLGVYAFLYLCTKTKDAKNSCVLQLSQAREQQSQVA